VSTARFAVITTAVMLVSFFGMKWLLTVRPLQPDARLPTFHHVDVDSPRYKLDQSSASDDDKVRDRLRDDVLDYAKALGDDPCNEALKAQYIKAVVAYARAWTSIAPCVAIRSCTNWDSAALDRAQKAFGTPRDHRVRDAMMGVHAKVTFGAADFPKDTTHLVADLAADDVIEPPHLTRDFRQHVAAQLDDAGARAACGR